MSFDDERALLLRWRDLVLETDPDVIIGYNIVNFDLVRPRRAPARRWNASAGAQTERPACGHRWPHVQHVWAVRKQFSERLTPPQKNPHTHSSPTPQPYLINRSETLKLREFQTWGRMRNRCVRACVSE